MKRIIILLISIASFESAWACDICGCGVGSYYVGILPEFSKKIIGVRYRYNSLVTHLGAGGSTSYLTTDETYRTAELWGGWTIGKKLRLMAYVPVSFNEKFNQGITTRKTGLGDVGVQGFYQVFDSRSTTEANKMLVHSLWVGAGVKVPTGKYEAPEKNGMETANIFQLGTGSVDFTLNAMYDLRLQDAGINTMVSYKMNTVNGDEYRYGNKFSSSVQAYYKFRIMNKLTLAPNAGLLFESAKKDMDDGYRVDVSGGHMLLGSFGAEITFKNIAIGGNYQVPASQNLAGGFVKANNRAMMHVAFVF
ncbi:MAG: transporter [Agriterribacter sp.]